MMKKLKLDQQKFTGAEVLSRTQLKKVMGGAGSGSGNQCSKECEGEGECTIDTPAGPFTGVCMIWPVYGGCEPDNVNLLCAPAY